MVADLICSLTVVDTAVVVVVTVVVVEATAVVEAVTVVVVVATAEVVAVMVITTLQAAATAATEACLDDDLSIVGADHTDEKFIGGGGGGDRMGQLGNGLGAVDWDRQTLTKFEKK